MTQEVLHLRDSLEKAHKFGPLGMRKVYGMIERKYSATTPYEVSCTSMWKGKMYLLFYYETYRDIRLVGVPPVKIGAFGGEQDNWSWPQHKGDFALFRIYGDKAGRPAGYDSQNVPVRPRKILDIAMHGVHESDYAMVIGFPGHTQRYLPSAALYEKEFVTNPVVIKARRDRLDVMKRHMEADSVVRLKYSEQYFTISNYADYAKWENRCLRRFDVLGMQRAAEQNLAEWIAADTMRKAQYGNLLDRLETVYRARAEAVRNRGYYQETWLRPSEVLLTANRVATLVSRMQRDSIVSVKNGDEAFRTVKINTRTSMKDFDAATDKEVLAKSMQTFTEHVPRALWGKQLADYYDRFGGDIRALTDYAYAHTCCTGYEQLCAWFDTPRNVTEILGDPMIALACSVNSRRFTDALRNATKRCGIDADAECKHYMHALYEMRESEGLPQYPDANSTMRLTYGKVCTLMPKDGVHCDYRSTINGYLEKYDPEDYEFRVDERMRTLIRNKEWGRWGEKGNLYVNFLTNNDITGGNSGSPVLDAHGHLIGLAFDGNRESMAGDVYYHPEYAKTVCVDIRFVLWIIEKYAGAGKLLDEMHLVP